MKMTRLDETIIEIEQGNAWDESDEVVQVEVKKPLDKVIPVRLPGDKWEEIRQEAKELGIGPTTLARMGIQTMEKCHFLSLDRGIRGFGRRILMREESIGQL